MLSVSVLEVPAIRVGVLIVGWNNDAYIKSMNSEVSLSFSQLGMFILKSPMRTISFFPGLVFLIEDLEINLQIHSQAL